MNKEEIVELHEPSLTTSLVPTGEDEEKMLGTFPKWPLLQGIFPSGNFPNVQFPKRHLLKSVLAAILCPKHVLTTARGPLTHPSQSARSSLQYLGTCHFVNCTFGKLPLGKITLGKIPSTEEK